MCEGVCGSVSVCTVLLTSINSSTNTAPSTTLNLSLTSQKFTSLPRAPSPSAIPPTVVASNIAGLVGRSKTASVPHKRMVTPVNDGYFPMLPKARPPLSTVLYPTAVPLPLNPQSPTASQCYYGDDLAPRTPEVEPCREATSEQSRQQKSRTFSQRELGETDDAVEHNLSEGLGGDVDYVNVLRGAEELKDVKEGQQVEYVNIQLGSSHPAQPVVSRGGRTRLNFTN